MKVYCFSEAQLRSQISRMYRWQEKKERAQAGLSRQDSWGSLGEWTNSCRSFHWSIGNFCNFFKNVWFDGHLAFSSSFLVKVFCLPKLFLVWSSYRILLIISSSETRFSEREEVVRIRFSVFYLCWLFYGKSLCTWFMNRNYIMDTPTWIENGKIGKIWLKILNF